MWLISKLVTIAMTWLIYHKILAEKSAKETQMYRTVFWTLWERERVG